MFKSKVHFAFYKSLKSRLIFMIFVLVLVPEVVLCFGILNTYESRAVSIRESEVPVSYTHLDVYKRQMER